MGCSARRNFFDDRSINGHLKSGYIKKIFSFILCFGFMMALFCGNAYASESSSFTVGPLTTARMTLGADGSWHYNRVNGQVVAGARETLSFPLYLDAVNTDISVSISADTLDLRTVSATLIVDVDGNLFPRELTVVAKSAANMQLTVTMEGLMLNKNAQTYVYIEALRTKNGGTVSLDVTHSAPVSFDQASKIRVNGYDIQKQSKAAGTIEQAVGLSNLTAADTVYIISKENKEIIRVLMENGAVMGLAIRDGEVIAGVELSLSRKVYVNTLTQKAVLTKDELIDIFVELDFSFMRSPNEDTWFSQQNSVQVSRSLTFEK